MVLSQLPLFIVVACISLPHFAQQQACNYKNVYCTTPLHFDSSVVVKQLPLFIVVACYKSPASRAAAGVQLHKCILHNNWYNIVNGILCRRESHRNGHLNIACSIFIATRIPIPSIVACSHLTTTCTPPIHLHLRSSPLTSYDCSPDSCVCSGNQTNDWDSPIGKPFIFFNRIGDSQQTCTFPSPPYLTFCESTQSDTNSIQDGHYHISPDRLVVGNIKYPFIMMSHFSKPSYLSQKMTKAPHFAENRLWTV